MKNSKENIKRNQRKQINSLEGKVCVFWHTRHSKQNKLENEES